MNRAFCVCVPARDEGDRLPRLLDALAAQTIGGKIAVALCINNSGDDSAAILARRAAEVGDRLRLIVDVCTLPPALAHAGGARGRAMAAGAAMLGDPAAALLSTDADCRPPADWITATLAAMTDDDVIVGGRLAIDADEALPPAVAAARARWDRYWEQVRAIEDAIDPRGWDAPPRHGDHTGASLALTVALYRAAGGVPALPSGEDRALVEAAIAAGGRLVHPPSVWTRVSPRREGRAAGGMAQAMAELHALAATDRPPMVPHFGRWEDRARWRSTIRARGGGERAVIAAERLLPPMPCDMTLPGLGRG